MTSKGEPLPAPPCLKKMCYTNSKVTCGKGERKWECMACIEDALIGLSSSFAPQTNHFPFPFSVRLFSLLLYPLTFSGHAKTFS